VTSKKTKRMFSISDVSGPCRFAECRFASHGFSYFVAVQRSSATADPGSASRSYLARLCQADLAFSSYVEVPLECRPDTGNATRHISVCCSFVDFIIVLLL